MLKLRVPELSCGHFASAIESAIKRVDGSTQVEADLAAKTPATGTVAETERIRNAISQAGYDNRPT